MTDLHAEASAILDGPTKTFALSVADILQPVAPPPPPPPPPPSGSILFQKSYFGTSAPYFGWDKEWGFQNIPATAPCSVTARGGLRMTIPTGAGSQHVEGLKKWPVKVGEDLYFGLLARFGSPWGEPSPDGWGAAICQLYYQAFVNHTWGLFAHANEVWCVILSGKQSWSGTPNQAGTGLTREYNSGAKLKAITGIQSDTDYRIVSRIRTAYDKTGLTQIWVKGGQYASWTKTVDVANIPTLQWGVSNTGKPLAFGATGYDVSHKYGYYTGTRTVQRGYEHDDIVIGTSLAAVQAAMA